MGFKSTNEIVALGETDPLVSESPTGEPVFNFQSAAEREEQSTAVNGSTGGAQSGATSAGAGGADDSFNAKQHQQCSKTSHETRQVYSALLVATG